MYKIGFTTVTFRKKSVDEILNISRRAGVRYLEWGGDIHVPPKDTGNARLVRAKCDDAGLAAVSYGSYYRVGDRDMRLFAANCHIAEILGAGSVRVWLGRKAGMEVTEEEFLSLCSETAAMADIAADYGLTVAFEFHRNTFNDCAGNTIRLLDCVGRENVRTYWQPFSDENDLLNLKTILPYLACVHVFNWDSHCRRYPLEEGKARWQMFLSAITAVRRDCNFLLEFTMGDSDECFIRDIACLRSMIPSGE